MTTGPPDSRRARCAPWAWAALGFALALPSCAASDIAEPAAPVRVRPPPRKIPRAEEGLPETGIWQQVAGLPHGETLEISEGRFRYWFWSDAVPVESCPIEGCYERHGDVLYLHPESDPNGPWSEVQHVRSHLNCVRYLSRWGYGQAMRVSGESDDVFLPGDASVGLSRTLIRVAKAPKDGPLETPPLITDLLEPPR